MTLIGPGGVGKTRVAAAVAGELVAAGLPVWFVELASLADPESVPSVVCAALGLEERAGHSPTDLVARCLAGGDAMLVLDNFEHLLAAAPVVGAWLSACPDLTILVTSRAVLHLSGEHDVDIRPLSVPDVVHLQARESLSVVGGNDSVRLFVARAAAATAEFELTLANVGAVAQICRRLEGLPLAIELAAARVRSLPPQALLARLDHRLPLLTNGPRDVPRRLQSVGGAIDWSYRALVPTEQSVFRQLSVFVGGCTPEAADAVIEPGAGQPGGGPPGGIDALASLVDKSLVRQHEVDQGEPRFDMLEMIREFASRRLEDVGEAGALRRRHAWYFVAFAEHADAQLVGGRQVEFHRRLDRDHANLRAALAWAQASGDVDAGLRLVAALAWFWRVRSHLTEGRGWLETVLSLAASDRTSHVAHDVRARLWVRALNGAGLLAFAQADHDAAGTHLEAGLALAREARDDAGAGWALHGLGRVQLACRQPEAAKSLLTQSFEHFEAAGDVRGSAYSRFFLGAVVGGQRDHAAAAALFRESEAVLRPLEDTWGLCGLTVHWANDSYLDNDFERAGHLYAACLEYASDLGSTWMIAEAIWGLAITAIATGNDVVGVRLFAAAQHLGDTIAVPYKAGAAAALERARARLSQGAFETAWRQGQALGTLDAVALASATASPRLSASAGTALDALSEREIEVLSLVAAGRTNVEIAVELVLSVRTVENHVSHVYRKLNLRNRVHATTFAAAHGLVARDA